ncbi:MAG: hypothetical protein ABF586_13255 [Sporolactobacillus sp.]
MQKRESQTSHRTKSKMIGRLCTPEDIARIGVGVKFLNGTFGKIRDNFIYRYNEPPIAIKDAYDEIRNVKNEKREIIAKRFGMFHVDPQSRSEIPLRMVIVTEKEKKKRQDRMERRKLRKRKRRIALKRLGRRDSETNAKEKADPTCLYAERS